MAATKRTGTRGFTLVELMIVVGIIGVLASVAIPSFRNYQLSSKRAEAFANLSSLATAQKAYYAEYNQFVAVAAEPLLTTGLLANPIKRDSTSVVAAFGAVGWAPEGDVFYDYDTATGSTRFGADCAACNTADCFTASAYGDLDGNNLYSVIMFAHPNAAGEYCTTGIGGSKHPPFLNGIRVFDAVVRVPVGQADLF